MVNISGFFREMLRRRVFGVAVLYIVAAWVVLQVADLAMESWGIPNEALRFVWLGMFFGFPIALIFGWFYDLTADGIIRTPPAVGADLTDRSLKKTDYILLGALAILAGITTIALVARILETRSLEPTTIVVQEIPAKSIAVLPFENLSQDASTESFAFGIHDDTLTQISRITDLKVISRTSVMEYRGTTRNLRTIGRELGVATILEGGVQRSGDRVRINAQLIDAGTDQHIWAETYDRQLTAANIFAIQTEIATAIATALKAQLSPGEQRQLATIPTTNMAALEAYFFGRQAMSKSTSTSLGEAIDYFQQAIELDPGFALAYAGLADTLILQVSVGGLPKDETYASAEDAIERAMQLNDQMAEVYVSLGWLRQHERDWDGAETALKRALELRPNLSSAYSVYGTLLLRMGRPEAALAKFEEALSLDPRSATIRNMTAWALDAAGRPAEAVAQFKTVIEIDPGYAHAYARIGVIHWLTYGQLEEAVRWLRMSIARDPGNPTLYTDLGFLYLDLGDDAQTEFLLNTADEIADEAQESAILSIILHQYRGEEAKLMTLAQERLISHPRDNMALTQLRNIDLRAGRYAEARNRYERAFPALLSEDAPVVDQDNYNIAFNLALVLQKLGEQPRAKLLLERSLQVIRSPDQVQNHFQRIDETAVLALQGRTRQALLALRRVADAGWRFAWWYYLEQEPNFDSIRDYPEFQSITQRIRDDMTRQLGRIREMEANGELASPGPIEN